MQGNGPVTVVRWLDGFGRAERMVCRVEVPGSGGTGFLIGPDLVLTSLHVVQGLLRGDDPHCARLVFGERRSGFHEQWLAGSDECRDFAVVRSAEEVGNDCCGDGVRGWLEIPDVAPELKKGLFLFIAQHPAASVLMSPAAVDAVDESAVHYRANTFNGSSGSPCFDVHLRLVAMHRAMSGGVPIARIRDALRLSLPRSPTALH